MIISLSRKTFIWLTLFCSITFNFSLFSPAFSDENIFDSLPPDIKEEGFFRTSLAAKWIGEHQLLAESLAGAISSDPTPQKIKNYLHNTVWDDSHIYSYFGSKDGIMTITPSLALPEGYDPRRRPWYDKTLSARKTTLSAPYQNLPTNDFILTLTTPAFHGTDILGIVGIDINTKNLEKLTKPETGTGVSQVFWINKKGEILLHPDRELSSSSITSIFPTKNLKIKENYAVTVENQPGTILAFFKVTDIPVSDWYLCFVLDEDNK